MLIASIDFHTYVNRDAFHFEIMAKDVDNIVQDGLRLAESWILEIHWVRRIFNVGHIEKNKSVVLMSRDSLPPNWFFTDQTQSIAGISELDTLSDTMIAIDNDYEYIAVPTSLMNDYLWEIAFNSGAKKGRIVWSAGYASTLRAIVHVITDKKTFLYWHDGEYKEVAQTSEDD